MTFREDPSVDYGGLLRRVPAQVVRPATVDDLARAITRFAQAKTPWTVRGAGHSATGETLTESAVIDTRALAGVVADDRRNDEVTALGGTTWLELWETLARAGRRPWTLTTHLRVTLGGTLAVGGVGDSSHLVGPQVASVRRLVLVTPDGERHTLAPGDPLFDHALCSHGQLGAIAEVTLATTRARRTVTGRIYRWRTLEALVDDLAHLPHAYVRPRVVWDEGAVRAWAIVADFEPRELARPRQAIAYSDLETVDLLAATRIDSPFAPFNPCLELVLPYPAGVPALARIDAAIARGPLLPHLPRGSSLQLVRGTPKLPLSPFRDAHNICFAIRPEARTLDDAVALEAPLRALADEAFAAGGRIYLTSFALAPAQLPLQLGAGAASLAALRAEVDPHDLCNPGSLHGWRPGKTDT